MSLRGQSTLRRNGKPQSCEPCRKSKLKCDHVLPKCGRCIQRKIEYRCIYHPAPMSKHTAGDTEASMLDSEHGSLVNRVSSVGTEPIDWIGPNVHTHRPSADAEKTAGDQPAGYLGPTSQCLCYKMSRNAAIKLMQSNLTGNFRLLCNIQGKQAGRDAGGFLYSTKRGVGGVPYR